ncbi:hypothetical protein QR680_016222 [Steinernema hermaphroditum]|uniref:G-protein coupled receptors family 1 profile domain-containing protein n=1 Tax=Steinernema hermaphroditum TaxID=289476 RepID=A0AA39HBF5_9BILA|nr:hypothetical protein QR680_016222 [Steinernema hermaphroditum]
MIDSISIVFRNVTVGCVALCVPLNLFTIYIIVKKSPKQLDVYKYILLKISLWVFLGDIATDIFLIPTPTPTNINALYPAGLSSLFGPAGGTVSAALSVFCVAECFIGLCIAFFFRYQALSHNFRLFGWQPEPMHYRFAAAGMVVVPPGVQFFAAMYGFFPSEDFTRMVLNENIELVPLLGNSTLVGPQKEEIIVIGIALSAYIISVMTFMVLCIVGIMKQLRALRPSMSAATYAMQVQLMKALVVQTATPSILFAMPICTVTLDLIFNFGCLRYGIIIMVFSMSVHSVVNSCAVMVLIAPYRIAVREMFLRKKTVVATLSVTA